MTNDLIIIVLCLDAILYTLNEMDVCLVECGTPPLLPQTKVVGGKNAAFGSWPWQVSCVIHCLLTIISHNL